MVARALEAVVYFREHCALRTVFFHNLSRCAAECSPNVSREFTGLRAAIQQTLQRSTVVRQEAGVTIELPAADAAEMIA